MSRRALCVVVIVVTCTCGIDVANVRAVDLTVLSSKIADETTVMPGSTATFESLGTPVMSSSTIAFEGRGGGQRGIYAKDRGGSLRRVADGGTPFPGTGGNFTGVFSPAVHEERILFWGVSGSTSGALFVDESGDLEMLRLSDGSAIDSGRDLPGTPTTIHPSSLVSVNADQGSVVFQATARTESGGFTQGIYAVLNGELIVVADEFTLLPDGSGNFTGFTPGSRPGIWGEIIGFRTNNGVYVRNADGTLLTVADRSTAVPDGAGEFTGFNYVVVEDGNVYFRGNDADGRIGLYVWTPGNGLRTIVNESTPTVGVPSTSKLEPFNPMSVSNGAVLFTGRDISTTIIHPVGRQGLYTTYGGEPVKLLSTPDGDFGVSQQAFIGNRVAYRRSPRFSGSELHEGLIVRAPAEQIDDEFVPPDVPNVVIVTHGWIGPITTREATEAWVREMVDAIRLRINDPDTGRPDREEWAVVPYLWIDQADTGLGRPLPALTNAEAQGAILGKKLHPKSYEFVHLIGHSAGAALITRAAVRLAALSTGTEIHTTYLDAFAPPDVDRLFGDEDGHIVCEYGEDSTWADHYRTQDLLYTQPTISAAYNVDITGLPRYDGTTYVGHSAARVFYDDSVRYPNIDRFGEFGYVLSMEAGSGTWPPVGRERGEVVWLGRRDTEETTRQIVGETNPVDFSSLDFVTEDFQALDFFGSDTGLVEADGLDLGLAQGSPAWYFVELEWKRALGFFTAFDYQFTSDPGAEGILSVYLDGDLLGGIDERFVVGGRQRQALYVPELPAGVHTVGFHLNGFTGTPSQVNISRVTFGKSVRVAEFAKSVVGGPDRNGDQDVDRAIQVRSREPSEYIIDILFFQPDLPPAMIRDTIPIEWELVSCKPQNASDLVLTYPTGRHRHRGYRETEINWFPTDNDSVLRCVLRTRRHSSRHYEPHKCGRLFLNHGAEVCDSSTGAPLLNDNGDPLVTDPLFIAAVRDKNHDGFIDFSGAGDEDGDGLSDFEECAIGTDPCHHDTNHDGIPDGADPDPS